MKKMICIGMALVMSHLCEYTLAAVPETMISTAAVIEELSRAEAERKVEEIVSTAEVRAKLESMGISQQEIGGRLASLSDSELRQMATQMEEARYGGDGVVGILVVVLLVLLIIFLAKRI